MTSAMAGMGDCILWWSGLYHFLKSHGLTPLSNAFFDAEDDELVDFYIFYKIGTHILIFGKIKIWEDKNSKSENNNKWGSTRC